MKNSINKVAISGFLGTDPVVRNLKSGKTMVSIRLGSVSFYKDKTGSWVTNTIWHQVVLWKALSAALSDQLKKGARIEVAGRLNSRMYTDQGGQRRYMTQIVASDISLAAN